MLVKRDGRERTSEGFRLLGVRGRVLVLDEPMAQRSELITPLLEVLAVNCDPWRNVLGRLVPPVAPSRLLVSLSRARVNDRRAAVPLLDQVAQGAAVFDALLHQTNGLCKLGEPLLLLLIRSGDTLAQV